MGIEDFGGGADPHSDVLIVTANDVPGYRVQQVIGEVFGLTVGPQGLGCARVRNGGRDRAGAVMAGVQEQ